MYRSMIFFGKLESIYFLRASLWDKIIMATAFENVCVSPYTENEEFSTDSNSPRRIEVEAVKSDAHLNIIDG